MRYTLRENTFVRGFMTNTPWGKSQTAHKIERGLTFHSTSGHGGFLVSKGYAKKHLSEAAQKRGVSYGGYLAYEEDCLASIITFEIPKSADIFGTQAHDYGFASLSHWNADYLLERGIEPDPTHYSKWLLRQEDDRLRAERSPDLIVSAIGIDSDAVEVRTADGSRHLVTKESYQRREGLNLLSKCDVLERHLVQQSQA